MKLETLAVLLLLLTAAGMDWKTHRIPNWLTLSSLVSAVAAHAFLPEGEGVWRVLGGVAAGFALLVLPYALGLMGAGDVKLLMAAGAWTGAACTFHAFPWIALFGGVLGLFTLVLHEGITGSCVRLHLACITLRDNRFSAPTKQSATHLSYDMPYGIPIALGFFTTFLAGGLFS